MRKNKGFGRKAVRFALGGALAFGLAGYEKAGAAEMSVRPYGGNGSFVPGGVYDFGVFVNNKGLGERTVGAQWNFQNSDELDFLSVSKPEAADDFFGGQAMWSEDFQEPGYISHRLIANFSQAPLESEGFLGMYKMGIPSTAQPGDIYNLDLTNTGLGNAASVSQPHSISGYVVHVTPEPASLGLLAAGAALVGLRRRKSDRFRK